MKGSELPRMALSLDISKANQLRAIIPQRRIIHDGSMYKQGRYNRAWRSRWFVLYDTRVLAYFNDQKESTAGLKPIAEIELTKVEHISNERSKDVGNKFVFDLITSGRTFSLACLDMEDLNVWIDKLRQVAFGNEIHHGWLIKKGERITSWRKRYFTLSDLKELRYFEDETQKKCKGIIDLNGVSIIRHGDKEQYGYEYSIEIITPDRTWVLVTPFHDMREEWMGRIDEAMQGGIRMDLLYYGYLWKFEQSGSGNGKMKDWSKKYYGIDKETLNLYYVQSVSKFKQFASTLFFDKEFYQNAVSNDLQGGVPIEHAVIEEYGNDDPTFDNTSQKSNPWIFRIKNVLGEHYFAADNELMMKEWIHHLNLAIGSGVKVIEKVTAGGKLEPSDTSVTGSDGDNGNNEEPSLMMGNGMGNHPIQGNQPKHDGYPPHNQYGVNGGSSSSSSSQRSSQSERYVNQGPIAMHRKHIADVINKLQGQNQGSSHSLIKPVPPISDQYGNIGMDPPPPAPAPAHVPRKIMKMKFDKNGMPILNDVANLEVQSIVKSQSQPLPEPAPVAPSLPAMSTIPQHQQQQIQIQHNSVQSSHNVLLQNGVYPSPHSNPRSQLNPMIPSKFQFGEREVEVMSTWNRLIAPYKGNPSKLESEAQFPCHFGDDHNPHAMNQMINEYNGYNHYQTAEMHERCGCVQRIATLMDYYMHWMSCKQSASKKQSTMGMAYFTALLSDYSMTELLNDFFHLKRFHAEDVADDLWIEPLTTYFCKNYGGCPAEQCVCVSRNNRSFLRCRDRSILRKWYYIDEEDSEIVGKSTEWEELATQQFLDAVHCYIYHGAHFSLNETTSPNELERIRKVYATRKQHFAQNRYITTIHPFHHIPYKPMEVMTPNGYNQPPHPDHQVPHHGQYLNMNNHDDDNNNNPLLEGLDGMSLENGSFPKTKGSGMRMGGGRSTPNGHLSGDDLDDAKFEDTAAMYEYTQSTFGIDQQHNIYQQAHRDYGPSKYYDFREEVLSHPECALSSTQWQVLMLKARILLTTFQGKLLRARKQRDVASTFQLDPKLYAANERMSEGMCQALLIYCSCEELRVQLMKTYFRIAHRNEDERDCRTRHYNEFYHFGKLLYTAIIAFGDDIYDGDVGNGRGHRDSFMVHKKGRKKRQFYYHNVSKPVLFNKFNASFYGPTSMTASKQIALIHLPVEQRDGIVLELDTNNVGWTTPFYLNLSIFSSNPSEMESLFHSGSSLGIHNIISVYHHKDLSNLSNYTSAITLLRYIIGDSNNGLMGMGGDAALYQQQGVQSEYEQRANELLDEFDQNICRHLEWLIGHQVEIYKNNKNINEYKNFSTDVPLYIALVLNSWCLHKQGIIQLNMAMLNKLPKPLQHKFVFESPDNNEDRSLNWNTVFNLFPNCNKVWMRGLYFNNYLCEQYVNFLCSNHISNGKYKMDGIVFSCPEENAWKLWVATAKKHSSIIKQMGWLITASPPKLNQVLGVIETGRVSFIKRNINKNSH